MDEVKELDPISLPKCRLNIGQNKYHVVILHERLGKTREDRYLVNIGLALRNCGHKVTIVTSYFNKKTCLEELDPEFSSLNIMYSGWWMPRSICGRLKNVMSFYKSVWMCLRTLMFPPKPRPTVIILDINTIALAILGVLSKYNVLYVEHFSVLKNAEVYVNFARFTPTLFKAIFMKHAKEIIVQTDCLVDIFRRSYPNVHNDIKVFMPCVDIGPWNEECINIKRIIPDLPTHSKLFVVFGRYRKKSNFRLALEAFDLLMNKLDEDLKKITHIVFAGHCYTLEEKLFYNELIELVKEKPHASQITFLRQLPIVHKKTLIYESTAVVHPAKYDVFPGPLTAAMHIGRPIIATNSGLAPRILSHRISGILVEPDPHKFAKAMHKIMMKPTLQMFIGDMAKYNFKTHYSIDSFSRRINNIILKYSSSESPIVEQKETNKEI